MSGRDRAGRGITILMADDDAEDCELTRDALQDAHLINEMRFVADGQELIDYLHHSGRYRDPADAPRPGIILLDLNMPKKDGREALAEIKADAALRRIPIVVLTTSTDDQDVLRSYDLGVSSFITNLSRSPSPGWSRSCRHGRGIGLRSSSCPTVSSIMAERCAVLLVEDDEDDYLIVRDMLTSQQRVSFEIEWQTAYNDALVAIPRRHDVYLVDYRLGERTGLELVRDAFADNPCAPVILLTGHGDYQIDLEATALGVTDYITKQELDAAGLERSIRYAISHHQALADLARSEERYALAVRAANDGIWDWDLTSDQIYLSPRWHAILGHPEPVGDEHAPSGRWFELVHEDDLSYLRGAINAHLAGHTTHVRAGGAPHAP